MAKIVPEKEHSGTFINPGSSPKIRHQIEHFETPDVSRISFINGLLTIKNLVFTPGYHSLIFVKRLVREIRTLG
jgi:hypothetical protein